MTQKRVEEPKGREERIYRPGTWYYGEERNADSILVGKPAGKT
jgi:hypothetical protein